MGDPEGWRFRPVKETLSAVEYGDWKNRYRQESLIFGGASLGFKAGTGITSAIMTGLLTYSGYISSTAGNVTQPAAINMNLIKIA